MLYPFFRDKKAARRSIEQLMAQDPRRAVIAHGDQIVEGDVPTILEQTYRFPVEGSGGLEAVKALAGRLVPEVEQVFLRMKEARAQSLQADSPENPVP